MYDLELILKSVFHRNASVYEDEIRIIHILSVCTFYVRGLLLQNVMEINTLRLSLTPSILGHVLNI
jgi:hypothetical protein